MWKCADPELEQQIHCFPYGECSDVPWLQQVEQKFVGRQRNLGLPLWLLKKIVQKTKLNSINVP